MEGEGSIGCRGDGEPEVVNGSAAYKGREHAGLTPSQLALVPSTKAEGQLTHVY